MKKGSLNKVAFICVLELILIFTCNGNWLLRLSFDVITVLEAEYVTIQFTYI
jgi:hypothetical protein